MKIIASNLAAILTTIVFVSSFVTSAHAAGPALDNLTQADFDNAIREMAGNSGYHSATGAGTLGSIFGIEVGVVAGVTTTPEINTLSKRIDASSDVGRLPHAAILAGVSVPLGFTFEGLFMPALTISGVKYQQMGLSAKWTASEALVLPFNLAGRVFITRNEISFEQTINNSSTGNVPVTGTVAQENSQMGFQILASPSLPMVEPYVGFGFINANGKLKVSGTSGTVFAFTSAQSAESSPTSTQFLLGVNVNLLLINFGVEFSRAFSTDSYNAKIGFRF